MFALVVDGPNESAWDVQTRELPLKYRSDSLPEFRQHHRNAQRLRMLPWRLFRQRHAEHRLLQDDHECSP